MILLDTNVVSEPMRPSPEARVVNWIDAQPLDLSDAAFPLSSLSWLTQGIETASSQSGIEGLYQR
jgi:predicted nucleic acid-binding protein